MNGISLLAPNRVSVVIVGGGHNGLAMSRCLQESGIDHVVLERGEIANSWRTERWDSLRLLTPNWQCRLPGYRYAGEDPDGFMTMPEVVNFIDTYAKHIAAPVRTQTRVTSISVAGSGYRVTTDRGVWDASAVVLAAGNFSVPKVPALAESIPARVQTLTARDYKNPGQLVPGRVLVVGASATGLQLAKESHEAGHQVTLAVGEHIRLPRQYRGQDIQYWMEVTGVLDMDYSDVDDIVRARRVPSPQLIGTEDHSTVDLNCLTDMGVEIVGRLTAIRGPKLHFSGSLANHCKMADLKMNRLLNNIDGWIDAHGIMAPKAANFEPTRPPAAPRLELGFDADAIQSVIWATGYKPDYSFVRLPVFDQKGNLLHDGGVVEMPGVYTMGLTFMRRRKSSFIHGAEDDARDLSTHLVNYLKSRSYRAAS